MGKDISMAEPEQQPTEEVAEEKPKRGRPRKSSQEKAKPVRRRRKNDWISLIEKVDEEQIVDYKISEDFTEKEAIRHKKFGVGVILKVLDENKIEVVFEENKKVLVQNWE